MIRQRREQRREDYEKGRRQWLLTRIGLIAFGVLVVVGIGVFGFTRVRDQQLNQVPDGVNTNFSFVGNNHVAAGETVPYAELPPVGGPHDAVWQNCGYYAEPIRSENGVHSLEHGAVWVTFRPDLPADQIERLQTLAGDQPYLLVSPVPDLPSPVVASAWNNQLPLESIDDDRFDQFVRYFQQGPQTVEPGARCSGGVGEPT